MTTIAIVLAFSVALILAGMPVAFAFGMAAFASLFFLDLPLSFVVPGALKLLEGFTILAVPLFILGGLLMKESLIAEKILNFADSIFGWVKGSTGAVTTVTCAVFGAISGVSAPAIAAIGSIMIPRMDGEGYDRGYATGLVACSSLLCLLIPPNVDMILFAMMSKQSVPICWLATIMPGLMIMSAYIVINFVLCRNNPKIKVRPRIGMKPMASQAGHSFASAIPAFLVPVVILGGIYGGIFTPTEAASVGVVVALVIGFLVYRSLTWKKVGNSLVEAATTTGSIMLVFFFIFMLSRVLIWERFTEGLASLILNVSPNKYVILLLLNFIMLVMGMLMDDTSGTILSAVILLPIAQSVGVSPVHFAAIMAVNLGMGNITPPTAPLLYMAGRVAGNIPLSSYIKPALIFLVFGSLPVLIITTFVPEVPLLLPHLFFDYPM